MLSFHMLPRTRSRRKEKIPSRKKMPSLILQLLEDIKSYPIIQHFAWSSKTSSLVPKTGWLGCLLKKKDVIYFLERKVREKERERSINQLPLTCPQLSMWPTMQALLPDRESNPWLFGYRLMPMHWTTSARAVCSPLRNCWESTNLES